MRTILVTAATSVLTLALTFALTLAVGAQLAMAQPGNSDIAKQRAADADAAASAGENDKALALYKQALQLDDSPRYRCNVGIAYYKIKDWPRSHLFLAMCLAHTAELDAGAVAQMGRAYAFVEKKLKQGSFAQVTITVTPKATVTVSAFEPSESFPSPRTVWLPRGKHRVSATADGYLSDVKELDLSATSKATRFSMELRAKPVEPPTKPDVKPDTPEVKPGHKTGQDIEPPTFTPDPIIGKTTTRPADRTPAWISFGIAGGALAGGILFHVLSLDAHDKADGKEPTDPAFQKYDDRFTKYRIATIGLYAISAAATAAGAYYWTRKVPTAETPALGLSLSRGGASVTTGWSF